ncbi:MAG: ubiquinol-cytochrome c reductase iron-sulfur subunit [Acidiferrobacteraceae bacterium]|jgi:ubiquinol-cytochrome c reductase iron-sulfur subunit|nr:ubiquinol-cytochrome c reductase iron-sulfur subunit [Acidiferrobacteraceae bacterium]MCP4828449.1 ubiquinol-cytochrome c reductase iron-sulfur subunit [Pseudomonadota bacterium]HJP08281.1 ubiquinol-cytochrome c reductase iron-sulfur subunit [Arenicellales bacterium]|tara:strand:+ start:896 stop:1498 length:603 start_codon:yes stop_codon:yes gene_type:complete
MTDGVNNSRRRLLTTVTTGVGLAGAAALAVPLVASMKPSARARAAGAPVEVDIDDLAPGQMKVVEWRGKPVWILRRDETMLSDLAEIVEELADPDSNVLEQQPVYARNAHRSIRPDVLVVLGVCTHLGCAPSKNFDKGAASGLGDDWVGGFFCPCHGSKFDLSGRVYKSVPAPTNLEVPPHSYVSDNRIIIGVDETEATA